MLTRQRWSGLFLGAGLLMMALPTAFAVVATGGNKTNDIDGYRILTFTNSGTLSVSAEGSVEVLVVAGGGGGGWGAGGGGGGGGLIYSNAFPVTLGDYPITVGAGGLGSAVTTQAGQNGGNSILGTLTAIGGGGGGSLGPMASNGVAGGSGGGGAGHNSAGNPGAGTAGQGNNGGLKGTASTSLTGSGGGGAGGVGATGIVSVSGFTTGGVGLAYSICSTSVTYSTGGKGSGSSRTGAAAGAPNTGNGGDGGGSPAPGTNGGSGIVIVRYVGGGAPVVSNVGAVVISPDVTVSNVTLNGFLVSTGWDANVSASVVWGTNDAGVKLAGWTYTNLFPGWSSEGVLATNVKPALAGALYYYRFFATNSFGYSWAAPAGSFTAPGMTIGPTQDSYVAYGASGGTLMTNVMDGGVGVALNVKGQNSAVNGQKSYIKFDLTGLDYNGTTSATLVVKLTLALGRFRVIPLQLYALKTGFSPGPGVLGTDWKETEITWSNAPANSTNTSRACEAATTTWVGTAYEGNPSAVGDPFVFTIPRLDDFVQADHSVTLILLQNGQESGESWASKEHSNASYRPALMLSLKGASTPKGTIVIVR